MKASEKASDMLMALRICGNHPSMEGKTCKDCPYHEPCGDGRGDARLFLEIADIIEALMKELAEARVGAEE